MFSAGFGTLFLYSGCLKTGDWSSGTVNGGRGRSSGEQHNFVIVTVKNLVSHRSGEENRSNIRVNISQLMGCIE